MWVKLIINPNFWGHRAKKSRYLGGLLIRTREVNVTQTTYLMITSYVSRQCLPRECSFMYPRITPEASLATVQLGETDKTTFLFHHDGVSSTWNSSSLFESVFNHSPLFESPFTAQEFAPEPFYVLRKSVVWLRKRYSCDTLGTIEMSPAPSTTLPHRM